MEGSLRLMLSSGYPQGKSTVKWNPTAYKKYEYSHLGLWYVKLTLCKRFLNWKKILTQEKVVAGKATFFVIDAFCTRRSILTLAFDMAVLYGNDAVSILVLSNTKRYSSYLKQIFTFRKSASKYWNCSKFPPIVTKKHANMAISQTEGYFKMKSLRKSVFQC